MVDGTSHPAGSAVDQTDWRVQDAKSDSSKTGEKIESEDEPVATPWQDQTTITPLVSGLGRIEQSAAKLYVLISDFEHTMKKELGNIDQLVVEERRMLNANTAPIDLVASKLEKLVVLLRHSGQTRPIVQSHRVIPYHQAPRLSSQLGRAAEANASSETSWVRFREKVASAWTAIKNKARLTIQEGEADGVSPWLERAGWHQHLTGLERPELIKCVDEPDADRESARNL
ncbi:hypothetical protein H2201_009028 [Coniosporium apollinis]|uniref:Mediator complex subunit 11 n=2 Tax=Coniosporium TaxID=2810619 RepID=A0ABQ9NEV9_9PEZI|nr:hypothetical protein H2199_009085 [Cladosporium sp. JES 115]KAJ9654221.1 hypothetical protein H2201_009028 [Coniosporium apollinis]